MSDLGPTLPAWLAHSSSRDQLLRLKHRWVAADEHGRLPALLLEWRETPDGLQARVVRPDLDVEDEKWRPLEDWLPAEVLSATQSA